MVIARRIRITGRVQGVFFRRSAKEKADELALMGWARNCNDGSVEIHVEGAPDAQKAFEDWCRKGPPAADVAAVLSSETEPEGCASFTIIR